MSVALLYIAILFFLGHGLRWVFNKTKVPDLLILIGIGYVLGPILGVIDSKDLGQVGGVVATIALVVILYEGGLEIHAKDLLSSSLPALAVSMFSFVFTVLVAMGVATIFALQSIETGLLFGLAMGCVSAAIVIPMVRQLNISSKLKTILSLESAFTDVLTIIIFLVMLDSFSTGSFSFENLLFGIGPKSLSSIGLGVLSGVLWAWLKRNFPQLVNMAFAGEAWAILTYGLIELPHYNGVLGVFALGLTLANLDLLPSWTKKAVSLKPVTIDDLKLLSEITFLLRTFFFIYLGLLANLSDWKTTLFAFIIAILIIVVRYFMVHGLFKKESFTRKDAIIAVSMGPRGLATAVLATLPMKMGLEGGAWIQETLFAVIPFSIALTAIGVFLGENRKMRSKLASLFGKYQDSSSLQKGGN